MTAARCPWKHCTGHGGRLDLDRRFQRCVFARREWREPHFEQPSIEAPAACSIAERSRNSRASIGSLGGPTEPEPGTIAVLAADSIGVTLVTGEPSAASAGREDSRSSGSRPISSRAPRAQARASPPWRAASRKPRNKAGMPGESSSSGRSVELAVLNGGGDVAEPREPPAHFLSVGRAQRGVRPSRFHPASSIFAWNTRA